MRTFLSPPFAILAALLANGAAAQQTEADQSLVDQGQYLATAGDCASCHGTSFAGGDPVPSPIGDIYATNITPDTETGIGSWTLAEFSDALRHGQAPDGHLYPAMPYTSYTGLSDDQVRALYSYLMLGVKPVTNRPAETKLPFPFYRPMMAVWNALFLDAGHPTGAVAVAGEQLERGRLLVETLGHCTACHTPRGEFMQERSDRHLAGAMVAGWWAPNITPDKTGIGGWSDDQLSTFLMTGHTDVAVAAGDMEKAVSHSLSKLKNDDIAAIVAYLHAVPAVASEQSPRPANADTPPVQIAAIELSGPTNWQEMIGHDTTEGLILYQSACASCHGVDGKGSADLAHPSLRQIRSVTGPDGATLVQVIAHGVDRSVGDKHTFMPAFRASMEEGQIASLANYVRVQFGGVDSNLTAADVATVLHGQVETPWLIENARWLAILAIVAGIVVLLGIIWAIVRSFGSRRVRSA